MDAASLNYFPKLASITRLRSSPGLSTHQFLRENLNGSPKLPSLINLAMKFCNRKSIRVPFLSPLNPSNVSL